MSQQSQYHNSLQEVRADEACESLLRNTNFVNWYRAPDSRQLVILGDMGCGKSVSMAFLIDTLRQRNERYLPQPKLCYYYCRDDETGQAIGIFSALILALLEQLSGLKKSFFDWYKQAQSSGYFEPATNVRKLEEFLRQVVVGLDRQLFLAIDGLDECDRASRNTLLNFLRDLLQRTPRIKILLSSRPHEEILEQLADAPRIDLVSNAERDRIIVTKTVEGKLSYLKDNVKSLIIERLSRMAQGSSIWTRMVVELIELRQIQAFDPMSRFLDEQTLPRDLAKLYKALLLRCTSGDPENCELSTIALRLLAVARRPLSILELAWGVALGSAGPEVASVAALAQLVDHQRLMGLIHPFISRVDFSDANKRQVTLVHQSIKEFVIVYLTSGPAYLQEQIASIAADQATIPKRIEILESHMLNICVRYLLLDEMDNINLFSEEQEALQHLPQDFDLFNDDKGPIQYDVNCTWEVWEEDTVRYDPAERGLGNLFVYASCYWIDHFGAITLNPLPDLASIEKLCRAGSTRLHNWIEQNCRPDCAIIPRFEFDSSLYDPLSITSLYGSEAMLRHMLNAADFDNGAFLPQSAERAVKQITQWGHMSRLRILFLENKAKNQLCVVKFVRLVMEQWALFRDWRQDWDVAFGIVDDVVDTLVQNHCGNDMLCLAARMGCFPLIGRLTTTARHHPELRTELLYRVQSEQQQPVLTTSVHQSIGEAVLGNHVDVVESLLVEEGIEAHLHYINSRGENVLHLASKYCNPAVFRLLIPRFPDGVYQKDEHGDTPLSRIIKSSAVSTDRLESAKMLLQEGSGAKNCDLRVDGTDSLREAIKLGDVDMCGLLIYAGGIDPFSVLECDIDGRLVLRDSSSEDKEGIKETLQLLRTHINTGFMPAN